MKAKVSERAVVARVRRKLKKDNQALRACKYGSRDYGHLGDWYIVNLMSNTIAAHHCDLETLAREVGALAGFEEIAEEEVST